MAPTQRPYFFSNFFSAFRARTTTNPSFQAKSAPTVGSPTSLAATAHTSSATTSSSTTSASQPRTITTKPTTTTTAASSSSTEPQNINTLTSPTRPTPPFSPTTASRGRYTHTHAPPLSRSPGPSSSSPHTNPTTSGANTPPYPRGRQRRGSDSSNSSGGFMDALGPEKWYVGGRSAGGEETFYRLGMVTKGGPGRAGSLDRLSL